MTSPIWSHPIIRTPRTPVSHRFGGARSDHPSATVVVVVEVLDVELVVESGTVVVLVLLVVDDEDVVVVGGRYRDLPLRSHRRLRGRAPRGLDRLAGLGDVEVTTTDPARVDSDPDLACPGSFSSASTISNSPPRRWSTAARTFMSQTLRRRTAPVGRRRTPVSSRWRRPRPRSLRPVPRPRRARDRVQPCGEAGRCRGLRPRR